MDGPCLGRGASRIRNIWVFYMARNKSREAVIVRNNEERYYASSSFTKSENNRGEL